jgi:hypothetical protein
LRILLEDLGRELVELGFDKNCLLLSLCLDCWREGSKFMAASLLFFWRLPRYALGSWGDYEESKLRIE